MSFDLSSAVIRALIPLVEKREKLAAELAAVEQQIAAAYDGSPAASKGRKVVASKTRTAPKVKRGAVKELILAGLREAGEAGIAVKHLAAKLGLKPQNIHVWLHTTGKKTGLIKAVSKGIYRLEEAVGVATLKSALSAPKPKVIKVRKKKAAK
ncbi:hypothetical protein BH09VER1_BH09VER1_53090 [soil metagenome]